jgi:DNA-binding beta-propeller fold protein YncE
MMANGVYVIDPDAFSRVQFIPTGRGAHGISMARDSKVMYVSNRRRGQRVRHRPHDAPTDRQVADPRRRQPGYGRAVGRRLSPVAVGRYNQEVYAFDTKDGHVIARIKVGKGPHGLAVFPQPGRYSLGHNGVYR